MGGNYNIFVGDKSYKTNFFLQFRSPRIERKFQEEVFSRNKYSLQGFLFLSLVGLVLHYMNGPCFQFYSECKNEGALLVSMLAIIASFIAIYTGSSFIILAFLLSFVTSYPTIAFADFLSYHTSILASMSYISLMGK